VLSLFRRRRTFLIWAPPYTHRSSGIRALYRLCHHLNRRGYPSAMIAPRGVRTWWDTPFHRGPVGDSIVVYPEIVPGNPLAARKVVRWALNDPGLLGGDRTYSNEEMVFVYDRQRLEVVSRAAGHALSDRRVLRPGLVDPAHIYPDPAIEKTLDCSFTHKGHALRDRFPLPPESGIVPLEDATRTMAALGDILRRTRTLYSYDHYSNVLREAAISGCAVRVIGEDGVWHDPRTCACPSNIVWDADLGETYAARFHDDSFLAPFIEELQSRWEIPEPGS
jgi:hypothetical protein